MSFVKMLNELCKNTMISHLGIEFTDSGSDFLKARMPVDSRTLQPMGLLHGGASLALAETVGSAASMGMIDVSTHTVVGMQVTGNHIGQAKSGYVEAHARLLHKGTRTHVWDVLISGDDGRNISACRVTNMIIEKQ